MAIALVAHSYRGPRRLPAYLRGLGQDEFDYYNGWSDGGVDGGGESGGGTDPNDFGGIDPGYYSGGNGYGGSGFDVSDLPLPGDLGPSVYGYGGAGEEGYFDAYDFGGIDPGYYSGGNGYGGAEAPTADDFYWSLLEEAEAGNYEPYLRFQLEAGNITAAEYFGLVQPGIPLSELESSPIGEELERRGPGFWSKVRDAVFGKGGGGAPSAGGAPSGGGAGGGQKPQQQQQQRQQEAARKAAQAGRPWLDQELISGLPNKWLLGIGLGVMVGPGVLAAMQTRKR